jgi:hypothetical protein
MVASNWARETSVKSGWTASGASLLTDVPRRWWRLQRVTIPVGQHRRCLMGALEELESSAAPPGVMPAIFGWPGQNPQAKFS